MAMENKLLYFSLKWQTLYFPQSVVFVIYTYTTIS